MNIEETLEDRHTKEVKPTDRNVSQELITRKMLLHGFQLASTKEQAGYVIEGTLKCKYHKTVTFDWEGSSTLLEHQYEAEFLCTLTDTTATGDSRVERIDIPFQVNGRTDEEAAKLDIRRLMATTVATRIVGGKMLGNREVKSLIDALGDIYETRTYEEIVRELKSSGVQAVPYLLDSLSDSRPVRVAGEYPDLEEWNKESFQYYHVADKALEEILLRTSGLALDSSEEYLHRVQLGWTWAWEDALGIPDEFRDRPSQRKNSVKAASGG